jgi:hypothetical protein
VTQEAFGLFDRLSSDSEDLIASFKEMRVARASAASAISAEVSQLRSLARDAQSHFGLGLADLLDHPDRAAELIELGGGSLGRSTVMTRSRAVQNLAKLNLGDREGRRWISQFRAALPKKKSLGWHDSGISLPGSRSRVRPGSPTPDSRALEAILRLAVARSPVDGAIAGKTKATRRSAKSGCIEGDASQHA